MDVRQLRSFIKIVEVKSFTKAAEQLHIAQPALGLQIRKLEEEVQVQLLVRHSRGVDPTPAGLVLLEHAHAIIQHIIEAKRALSQFTGPPRGRVALGLTPSINYMISADLIRRSSKELPHVTLLIEEQLSAGIVEWVALERLDMCLAYKVSEHPNLIFEPLFRENLYFICRKGYLPETQKTISLQEIAHHSLIMPGNPHGLRRLMEEHAAKAGIVLDVAFEMQSVSVVRNLVADGVGSTILPYGGARRSIDDDGLMAARIVDPDISRDIYLCYLERRIPSVAEEHLRVLIRTLVGETVQGADNSWVPAI